MTATETTGAQPTVWYSRLPQNSRCNLNIKCKMASGEMLDLIERVDLYRPPLADLRPSHLVLGPRFKGIPGNMADSFIINGGIIAVSPRLKAILDGFDLGESRLYEVPILQADGETPTAYPPYHLLHVAQTRTCLAPEASENIEQMVRFGEDAPRPDARWVQTLKADRLAVRGDAVAAVDLWADPRLKNRLFFSDRLKRAMDDARITSESLRLIRAVIVA